VSSRQPTARTQPRQRQTTTVGLRVKHTKTA